MDVDRPLPNLKISVDLSEDSSDIVFPSVPIDFDSNVPEPVPVVTDPAVADDDVEITVSLKSVKEQTKQSVLFQNEENRKYENTEGDFITGLDLSSEEIQKKLQERAKRFGLTEKEKQSGGPKSFKDDLFSLYESLGLSEDKISTEEVRTNAIHLRGVEDMSTADIFDYFKEFSPGKVEWIDDHSCNVVWLDPMTAARAMIALSRPKTQPAITPDETDTNMEEAMVEVDPDKTPTREDQCFSPIRLDDDDDLKQEAESVTSSSVHIPFKKDLQKSRRRRNDSTSAADGSESDSESSAEDSGSSADSSYSSDSDSEGSSSGSSSSSSSSSSDSSSASEGESAVTTSTATTTTSYSKTVTRHKKKKKSDIKRVSDLTTVGKNNSPSISMNADTNTAQRVMVGRKLAMDEEIKRPRRTTQLRSVVTPIKISIDNDLRPSGVDVKFEDSELMPPPPAPAPKPDLLPTPEEYAGAAAIAEGIFRVGVAHAQSSSIVMRFATPVDVKRLGAERRSWYYVRHGNPNYGGLRGIISNSMRRKLHGVKMRQQMAEAREIVQLHAAGDIAAMSDTISEAAKEELESCSAPFDSIFGDDEKRSVSEFDVSEAERLIHGSRRARVKPSSQKIAARMRAFTTSDDEDAASIASSSVGVSSLSGFTGVDDDSISTITEASSVLTTTGSRFGETDQDDISVILSRAARAERHAVGSSTPQPSDASEVGDVEEGEVVDDEDDDDDNPSLDDRGYRMRMYSDDARERTRFRREAPEFGRSSDKNRPSRGSFSLWDSSRGDTRSAEPDRSRERSRSPVMRNRRSVKHRLGFRPSYGSAEPGYGSFQSYTTSRSGRSESKWQHDRYQRQDEYFTDDFDRRGNGKSNTKRMLVKAS